MKVDTISSMAAGQSYSIQVYRFPDVLHIENFGNLRWVNGYTER